MFPSHARMVWALVTDEEEKNRKDRNYERCVWVCLPHFYVRRGVSECNKGAPRPPSPLTLFLSVLPL